MRKWDFFVIFFLVAIAVSSYWLFHVTPVNNDDSNIIVYYKNKVLIQLDINKDIEYPVKLDKGKYSIIKIKDKKVCVKESNCPRKICVKFGWIKYPGQTIVCAAHNLVVRVKGNQKHYDMVSY